MAKQESTVKWFDAKKGYGFINHPDGGDDVFVHYSQITSEDDFKTLRTGQEVEFDLSDGPKGLHALDVVAVTDATGSSGDASLDGNVESAPIAEESDLSSSDLDAGYSDSLDDSSATHQL